MRHFLRLFTVICLLSSASAAEPADLGQGLTYLRINSLVKSAEILTTALNRTTPLVLDLRYTADEPAAADILRALNSHAAKPRLYVLVSPATPVPVVGVIASRPVRWLVTLGVTGSLPEPQVVVQQSAEADRIAYNALETGTPLTQLVSGKIDKERFDEASLVQEFKNGNLNAHPPALSQAEGPKPGPAKPAVSPAAPTDRVLQRAVHLHRALQALKHG